MVPTGTIVTFALYLIFLLGVGSYFFRRTKRLEDYLLGGRGMGAWVTALSAQASDMSGWLLMGLPGAVYLAGGGEVWIAIGLFIGTVVNWVFVSSRLRVYTHTTRSLTLPSFFEDRFRDPTGLLRIVGAVVTLFFFTIYASSGLLAAGKLFQSMFGIEYYHAVAAGVLVIVVYTILGGFLAVCWTDFFQGSLMLIAIVVVPAIACEAAGGLSAIGEAMDARGISKRLIADDKPPFVALLAIVSTMAWGLGYFGQPHILARFMGIRSHRELPKAMTVAIVWVFLSLVGALCVGFVAIPMYEGLADGDQEKVFIYMVRDLFNPWIGGVLLAAILSAIMSTIDSQLLVSSSALTEDLYKRILKRGAFEREVVLMGRGCVALVSAFALRLALDENETVLGLVSYAWGGFGAAFGPLVLFALFSKQTTWQSALAGMVTGTVVLVVWKQLGWSAHMYEIVPGFVANCVVIAVVNLFVKQGDTAILVEYDAVVGEVGARGDSAQ